MTFHSIEDRIVKNTFHDWTSISGDPHLPTIGTAEYKTLKTRVPNDVEISENPRSRSAHLRAVEKV